MSSDFDLEVVCPSKPVARVKARSVSIPALMGYTQVMPSHTPYITEIGVGSLEIEKSEGGSRLQYFVAGGYAEVTGTHVTVLAETIETREEMDRERATTSLNRAKERLNDRSEGIDIDRALDAHKRAQGRIDFMG